jgi:hypothetical protein
MKLPRRRFQHLAAGAAALSILAGGLFDHNALPPAVKWKGTI